MANIYVATTGNDTTGTGSSLAPYATFAKAITVAVPGDTIIAKSGTYAQRINLQSVSATQGAKLTIRSETPLGAVVTGVDGTLHNCLINDCNWIRIEDFDFNHTHTVADKKGDHCVCIQGGSEHVYVGGCRFRTRLGLTPSLTDLDTNYNQGYRTAGVSLRANTTFPEVDNCTFVYTNKGIHSDGVVTDSYIHDCTFSTIQSPVHFNSGTADTHCRHVIDDCLINYSHMEDGFQTNPNFDAPNGTLFDCLGFLLRRCTFIGCQENVIDTKGGADVFFERCVFRGQTGNNNGLHATLKTEGGSPGQVTCGANEITKHRVGRFNTIYDGNGPMTIWDRDCYYNNTFWGNRRNFDGYNSGSQLTKHKGVQHSEGSAMTESGVKNNIFGHCYVGASLRTIAASDLDIDYNYYVNCDHVGGNDANTTTYDSLATWQGFVQARGWTTEGEANSIVGSEAVDTIFANFDELPTGDFSAFDTSILDTSLAYQSGGWLTRANGTGSSTTTLVVDNSNYFRDDWGRSDIGVTGDPIYIEGAGARTVTAVNWDTHTITLNTAASWANNAKIYYGTSATPNIGAGSSSETTPPETGGGAGSVVALGRAAANTAVAEQAIPVVGLEDAVLDAWTALVIVTSATADGVAAATALASVGFACSSGDQVAVATRNENAKNPPNTIRRAISTGCICIPNLVTNANAGVASITSVTTGVVTFTWSTLPPSGYLVHVALFNSIGHTVGHTTLSPTVNGTAHSGAAFDLMLVAGNQKPVPNTTGNSTASLSFGAAANTGTLQQACLVYKEAETSPTTPTMQLNTNYVFANLSGAAGPIQSGAEIGNVAGDGFDFISRVAGMPASTDIIYMAMEFDDLDCSVGTITTPAANGAYSLTGVGFAPGFIGLVNSMLTANNTGSGSETAGAFGFSLITSNTQYSTGFAVKDASVTTDTESYSDDSALLLHQHDGSDGLAASLTTLTGDGATLSVTASTGATHKSIFFAIQGVGSTVTPAVNVVTYSTIDPTVRKGSMSITPAVNVITYSTVNPTVSTGGEIISPAANEIVLSTINPTVAIGSVSLTPEVNVITYSTVNPTIQALNLSGRVLTLRRRSFIIRCPKRLGMSSIREILESPLEQGEDEQIAWIINTTNWGGEPGALSVVVAIKELRLSGNVDVSESKLTGDATVSGNYITTPVVAGLRKGKRYRLEVRWTGVNDNTEETYAEIRATE